MSSYLTNAVILKFANSISFCMFYNMFVKDLFRTHENRTVIQNWLLKFRHTIFVNTIHGLNVQSEVYIQLKFPQLQASLESNLI